MSWIDIAWPMMGGASLTLGLIHLVTWIQQHGRHERLIFAIAAFAVAILSVLELQAMRADSPDEHARVLRWGYLVLTPLMIAFPLFVRVRFRAGRLDLLVAFVVLRLLALVANFVGGANLSFTEIHAMLPVAAWGGAHVFVPIGTTNPWVVLAHVAVLLLIVFLFDAQREVRRRGDDDEYRAARRVCLGMIVFLLTAVGSAALITYGQLQLPFIVNPPFLAMLAIMSYELSSEVVRGAATAQRLSRSEAMLRESEQRSELAVQAARIATWSWCAADGQIALGDRGRELFGFAGAQQVDLERFLQRIHADDRECMRSVFDPTRQGEPHFECEYRVMHEDGSIHWVATRGRTQHDPNGLPVAVLGASLDVSRVREAEHESNQQRSELAHLARVATIGEMSASLAHELNQPLTAILANSQAALHLLGGGPEHRAELEETLVDIAASGKRAGEVIRRLRSMLTKSGPQHRPLDLNHVVSEVVQLYRSELINREVVVELELLPELPVVLGDRVQLQQVLLNLVINACDAMDHGGQGRCLSIATAIDPEGNALVSVRDLGGGIAADQLERVFEPFVTTKSDGMGLGLSVCRTLVREHGGRLWAMNHPGGGAVFQFTLPAQAL